MTSLIVVYNHYIITLYVVRDKKNIDLKLSSRGLAYHDWQDYFLKCEADVIDICDTEHLQTMYRDIFCIFLRFKYIYLTEINIRHCC